MNAKLKNMFALLMLFVLLTASSFPVSAANPSVLLSSALSVAASVPPGVYYADNGIDVRLSSANAFIVFTTDGSTPAATRAIQGLRIVLNVQRGVEYLGPAPIKITGSRTLKAIALSRTNILMPPSPVLSFSYEVYSPTALRNAVVQKFNQFNFNSYDEIQKYTAKDGSLGSLSKTYAGITPGTVNCTWYTFVRIRHNLGRTVLFTSAGGLNGKYWYSKIVSNSNQIKYANLENLIESNKNRPIYNVVVSFERNGTGTAGHVMLIDAIINGVVYYSDNSQPGKFLTKNSVSEFKKAYSGFNGNIVGVVHLK